MFSDDIVYSKRLCVVLANQGFPPDALRRIILTASGGAFRDWPAEDLVKVRLDYLVKLLSAGYCGNHRSYVRNEKVALFEQCEYDTLSG